MPKKTIAALVFGLLCFPSIILSADSDTRLADKNELYRQVGLFADSLAIIQMEYVDEISSKEIIYGALKGMLASLDPHSQFMDPDTYNELKVDTEGKFGGLGIEITIKDGLLTVVTPIEDTPAWKAGVKANDRIVKINDELTRDITLVDAVKKLRGEPGDPVNITILRESEKKILEFRIFRDIVNIKDIKEARILENGIAYLRLVEFRENTAKNLDKALEELQEEGMSALILDLRNNPGGLLDVAVEAAERFIEKDKMVVYTKGRKESQNLEFRSRFNKPILNLPMVVLINEGSASGSEIVAGCLQDHKRAMIVGKNSFGKGSVQTVIPLSDGSALRITTSKYFTPSGREIHGKGVVPDIEVETLPVALSAKGEGEDVFEKIEVKDEPQEKKDEFDYKLDSQLIHAIDALKAVKFYKENGAGKNAKAE